ncbi:MAG TPA: glycosyltransferase [Candidatus Cloacimonadota bacterium]|nr:glycosyltransferase [Candidatus Cloacimonadota bacterium]
MDFFTILFSFFVLIFTLGLLLNKRCQTDSEHTFSILIACRNEEQNLPALFLALDNIIYPKEKYEIIITDDASTDNSARLLSEFSKNKENVTCLFLQEKSKEFQGKQAALKLAAEKAKFDFLVFTDADCEPESGWLNNFNRYISDAVGMVVGYYRENELSTFQTFINKISAVVTAATIGLGLPMTASGSNLLIRRSAFEEVGGYEKIRHFRSGDDKHMLNLIRKAKWKITFKREIDVLSKISIARSELKHRNMRKYSTIVYSSAPIILLSIFTLAFYFSYPVMLFVDHFRPIYLLYPFSLLFLWIVTVVYFKLKFKFNDLFFLLIYPYVVIWYSINGIWGKWEWKK